MKKIISNVIIVFFIISTFSGCATTNGTVNKTAADTGIGAITGAIAGYLTTGNLKGTLIGAVGGGLAGFAFGKYEEKQVRTRAQVYREYPRYAKCSTAPAPTIKDLRPELLDTDNRLINTFRAGQEIKMTSMYTIVASPAFKYVEVTENNYLIAPDGSRTPDRIRKMRRPVETVIAKQAITFKQILPGRYIHVAIVKIGNQTLRRKQIIEIAGLKTVNKKYKRYASN